MDVNNHMKYDLQHMISRTPIYNALPSLYIEETNETILPSIE
jgi:hypothetical protein